MYKYPNLLSKTSVWGFKDSELKDIKKKLPKEYSKLDIPKKSGGFRTIYIPSQRLKSLLRIINPILQSSLNMPVGVCSSLGQGLIKHLKPHCNQQVVVTVDVRDFYPSVKKLKVKSNLLNYTNLSRQFVEEALDFTFVEDLLPQGFPTSPFLASISILDVWFAVKELSLKLGVNITVYTDDWAISGKEENVFQLLDLLRKLLLDNELTLSSGKKKIMRSNREQLICNIKVNSKNLEITEKYIKELEEEIEQFCKITDVSIQEDPHIMGKIAFVKSINREQSTQILKKYCNL